MKLPKQITNAKASIEKLKTEREKAKVSAGHIKNLYEQGTPLDKIQGMFFDAGHDQNGWEKAFKFFQKERSGNRGSEKMIYALGLALFVPAVLGSGAYWMAGSDISSDSLKDSMLLVEEKNIIESEQNGVWVLHQYQNQIETLSQTMINGRSLDQISVQWELVSPEDIEAMKEVFATQQEPARLVRVVMSRPEFQSFFEMDSEKIVDWLSIDSEFPENSTYLPPEEDMTFMRLFLPMIRVEFARWAVLLSEGQNLSPEINRALNIADRMASGQINVVHISLLESFVNEMSNTLLSLYSKLGKPLPVETTQIIGTLEKLQPKFGELYKKSMKNEYIKEKTRVDVLTTLNSELDGTFLFKPNETLETLALIYESKISGAAVNTDLYKKAQSKNPEDISSFTSNGLGIKLIQQNQESALSYQKTADKAQLQLGVLIINLGLQKYFETHGELPKTLEALIPHTLSQIPLDPWGEPIHYYPQLKQLCSWGDNQTDDGCIPFDTSSDDEIFDLVLWTPQKEEEEKKELLSAPAN